MFEHNVTKQQHWIVTNLESADCMEPVQVCGVEDPPDAQTALFLAYIKGQGRPQTTYRSLLLSCRLLPLVPRKMLEAHRWLAAERSSALTAQKGLSKCIDAKQKELSHKCSE